MIGSISGFTVSQLLLKYYEWEMDITGYDVINRKMRTTINSVVRKATLCASKLDLNTLAKGLRHTHLWT
jgi:hypothetical protein